MKRLLAIQNKIKCTKNQHNDFGNYNYRSCEDILVAVKPLLEENGVTLILTDDIIATEGGRHYIGATATLYDTETGAAIAQTRAFAREAETKKGMDDSQITGTASSYARKYALNGLFLLDDNKDADTNEYKETEQKASDKPSEKQINLVKNLLGQIPEGKEQEMLDHYHVAKVEEMSKAQMTEAIKTLMNYSKKGKK